MFFSNILKPINILTIMIFRTIYYFFTCVLILSNALFFYLLFIEYLPLWLPVAGGFPNSASLLQHGSIGI